MSFVDHPNAVRLRELFDAFRRHDIETVQEVLDEDVEWRFPGRVGRLAGSHRGHAEVFRFLLEVQELTDGTFSLDIEDVIANDRLAVVFFRGSGAREGRRLDNPTALKVRFEDGRVVAIDEFVWDLYTVDEFWS